MPIYSYDELQAKTREIAPDVSHSSYTDRSGGPEGNWKVQAPAMDDTFMKGRVRFTREYEGWRSGIYVDPTHGDVLRAMQESIEDLNDRHHIFFEGISVKGAELPETCERCGRGPGEDEGPITTVEIYTGS